MGADYPRCAPVSPASDSIDRIVGRFVTSGGGRRRPATTTSLPRIISHASRTRFDAPLHTELFRMEASRRGAYPAEAEGKRAGIRPARSTKAGCAVMLLDGFHSPRRLQPCHLRRRPGRAGVAMAALAAIMFGATAVRATPVTFDATADYSAIAGNPNGVWSYGWEATGGAAFTPYTAHTTDAWLGNVGGDGTPAVWKNTGGSTAFGVSPGQIALHPGPGNQPSIVRWTAPASITGPIHVAGQFFAGDVGVMQVGIFLDDDWAAPLFQATDAGAFSFDATVSPGDTIDFAVYGAYGWGNTPLDARITAGAVPEIDPAAMAGVVALLAGAAGLHERRRPRAG